MKTNTPLLSIIIPVLNESTALPRLLNYLDTSKSSQYPIELIVIDGGSTDTTREVALAHGAKVLAAPRGRASQMNLGARMAKGSILYFLHADTYPPHHFDLMIVEALSSTHKAGCFRMRFDNDHPLLKFFAWCSRINHSLCRGGDQSLFIRKSLFDYTGGFNTDYRIYEDTEFISRLYKQTGFRIIPKPVITSARKYEKIGVWRLQFHFGMIHLKNYLGMGPEDLYRYYCKNISA